VFRSQQGAEIRVGRSARDNDDLTFRSSRGNDVWLHTADAPGSHVVLGVPRGDPDSQDVLDAAHLAVHFSPLRGRGGADVHVARVKDVRKPRGAKPGLVSVAGGKILRVRVEAARLATLLGTQRRGGEGDE
jgi:predicted ribosome quality control (RQC) complex YloA/Tae2 family protein